MRYWEESEIMQIQDSCFGIKMKDQSLIVQVHSSGEANLYGTQDGNMIKIANFDELIDAFTELKEIAKKRFNELKEKKENE